MDIFKNEILKSLKKHGFDDIKIEIPPDSKLGDYAIPCFMFTKKLKKDPRQIASDLKNKLRELKYFSRIESIGPYLNFFVDNKKLIGNVLGEIIKKRGKYGSGNGGKNKKILIEHTSINPNASPHVGRARNAMIGDAIKRIFLFQGYKLETHFYVNDVGKQIAMLVFSAGNKKVNFEELLKHYVQINKKIEENPKLEEEIFELLRKFEKNDKKTVKKFKDIVKICIDGQIRILSELGIKYDKLDYESDYLFNKEVKKILERLQKNGKLFEDEKKRLVLDQRECKLAMKNPVLVLTRADKTSLYPLRDLAYTVDKFKKNFYRNIIVLGEDQKLYAQQLKCALNSINEKYPETVHYSFVLLEEGKMSTRRGNLVLLEDFMNESLNKAKNEIKKRYGEVNELTAKKIAYGAIKFSILRVSAEKNVTFNWKNALSFEGESGPYIQYSYARICSIFKKYGKKINLNIDVSCLKNNYEINLIKLLSKPPNIIDEVSNNLKIHIIANYLIELAKSFNEFYNTCPVLKEGENLKKARLVLCYCVKQVLGNCMKLLGIEPVERM